MEPPYRSRSPKTLELEDDGSLSPSPEQRLMVAIVRRAVWDFVLYREVSEKRDPERYGLAADAAGWLFWDGEEETVEGLYTFRYICAFLNLNPQRVRDGIMRLKREDIQRLNNNIKESA